jgi:hypothetical protein
MKRANTSVQRIVLSIETHSSMPWIDSPLGP